MNPNFVPTTEQWKATERFLDAHGKPYYTARSAHDPDTLYYVRWRQDWHWPHCSCKDGGYSCWHAATAMYREQCYQEALQDGELQARMREELAVKRDGVRAYQPRPFSLLKTA